MEPKTYGRLTVISRNGRKAVARCICGKVVEVWFYNITNGHTRSCGCLQKERTSEISKTHGMTRSPTWNSWRNMLNRCNRPTQDNFSYYGGRGIKVAKRWYVFQNFLNDMGVRPNGTTLDRVDHEGPYTKKNCRWATHIQQANNKRNNVFIMFNGTKRTIADWARITGLARDTISKRLKKGLSPADILKPSR